MIVRARLPLCSWPHELTVVVVVAKRLAINLAQFMIVFIMETVDFIEKNDLNLFQVFYCRPFKLFPVLKRQYKILY